MMKISLPKYLIQQFRKPGIPADTTHKMAAHSLGHMNSYRIFPGPKTKYSYMFPVVFEYIFSLEHKNGYGSENKWENLRWYNSLKYMIKQCSALPYLPISRYFAAVNYFLVYFQMYFIPGNTLFWSLPDLSNISIRRDSREQVSEIQPRSNAMTSAPPRREISRGLLSPDWLIRVTWVIDCDDASDNKPLNTSLNEEIYRNLLNFLYHKMPTIPLFSVILFWFCFVKNR